MAILKVKSNGQWVDIPSITGNGIAGIAKTGTEGLVDTYTVTMTDGNTATFTVTNGAAGTPGTDGVGIRSIAKTGTSGNVDTYTITMTNGTTSTFTVTNGTAQIDDEAGEGDTTKTWSADKLAGIEDRVSELENTTPAGSGGITVALRAALLQLAEKVGYIDNSGPDCYQDLYDALYSSGEVVTISSVDAVLDLEGHSVVAGDSLDTLRPYLTVTVTYSDESQRTVSTYTLSGTLVTGSNTITVTYEGETDTITVVAEAPSILPAGYTEIPSLYCAGESGVYISTGVMSGDIDCAEYSIMPTDLRYLKAGHVVCATNHYYPFMTGDNTNGERSRIGFKNMGNDDSSVSAGSYVFPWAFNEKHTLMGFSDGKVYVDGTERFTVPAGSAASSEIVVFGAPDVNRFFVGRLYWMKFYKDGTVYRNYLPCKNSSNVVGLYETVTGTFLYNANASNIFREGGE